MIERSRSCIWSEPLESRVMLAGEPWGAFAKLIKQDVAIGHYPSINGSGQSVAIIDTGVDYMHPGLGGGFGPGFKVVADMTLSTTIRIRWIQMGMGRAWPELSRGRILFMG